ncbi:MAG: beta-hexosaminidase [Gammaproteobacteria bacterium]|nr:MAG: beta-hexosaminidase [Gammaproteobacteria bacterium]
MLASGCRSTTAGRPSNQMMPGTSIVADVIPAPAAAAGRAGVFVIRASTHISVPSDAQTARIGRYLASLLQRTRGVRLEVVERVSSSEPDHAIVLRLDPHSSGSNPESYEVDVTPQRIVLSAREPRGLFYGTVTLWELCTADGGHSGAINVPAMRISDAPRFAWRGLMLDSARHYQSPDFILELIDWMALHKLNVLHWHLTDDQGWRLEIQKYPRLTAVGAWRVPAGTAAAADIDPSTGRARLYGGLYSQDAVRRIVAHAADRNVTIVPEIEMPGHATAAIVAYPQLGSTDHPPPSVPADWGIYTNLYNVEETTFAFLEDVLDEVMALFPGEYIHVGGDEAVKDQWVASARVQARMRELGVPNDQALQGYFTRRIEKYLNAHGRRLIGWDEILEGGIAAGATVMSWRGTNGAISAASAGHDTVLSPWPTLYFDNRQGGGPAEPPGRGRIVSLEDVYRFDPLPEALASQRQHVLGLQANVWTEHIRTEDRVAYMTFPRAAAVAEIGWSAPERRQWRGFLQRLPAELARYQALGMRYSDEALRPDGAARRLGPFDRHMSQDLKTCTDKLVLSLEDDAPLRGERAIFLIDIMNPCWIFESADLSQARSLQAAVGQVPFNFQIGRDIEAIKLNPPRTPDGELEVRMDGCEGEPIAVLPLASAVSNDAVTVLPAAQIRQAPGRHDLCLRFTQRTLDPMWAIDWVKLLE